VPESECRPSAVLNLELMRGNCRANLLEWDEPFALQNIVELVYFQVLNNTGCTRWPADLDAVDFGRGVQAKVYAEITLREIASPAPDLICLADALASYFRRLRMRGACIPRSLAQPSASLASWIILLVPMTVMCALASAQITTTPAIEPSMRLVEKGRFGQSQLDGQLRSPDQNSKIRARAQAGSARDEFLIGYAYTNGLGQPQDLSQGLAWYLKAANQGEPAAITELGRMYVRGIGVSQNYEKGLEWLRRAAADGYAPAQTDVGLLYFQGLGVAPDVESAVRWWEKAARDNYAPAQSNLGVAYLHGMGVRRDPARATQLFRNAADAGLDTAQFDLASCYETGQGVPQDLGIAAEWYRKAAQQGDPGAQNNLASMYQSGRGVPADAGRALRLFLLAAENGNMKAAVNLANTFQLGIGVKPDSELSCMWLQVASGAGGDQGPSTHRPCSGISDHQLNQARQQAWEWRAQHHLVVDPSKETSTVSRGFSSR